MSARHISLLYRDVDRLAFLHALVRCARVYEQLKRGEVDAIGENYWGLQRLRAAGAPFITVASSVHAWIEWLLVRPGINRKTLIPGPEGKTIRGGNSYGVKAGPPARFAVQVSGLGNPGDGSRFLLDVIALAPA